jgi:hypothetical protein
VSILLPLVPVVDNRLFVPDWEQRERERLDAARCPDCGALPPNHRTSCGKQKLPDPEAKRCRRGCGYVAGSLGCRLTHGSRP